MSQKDVGNKIPIYKLKTTDEVMKYYDEWGHDDKYNRDMINWSYTGPKETVSTFIKYEKNKNALIFDAGCGTGLVGTELKKYGYNNFHGADLSQKLLNSVPKNLYKNLKNEIGDIQTSVTDVSENRTIIRISGDQIFKLLSKFLVLDLEKNLPNESSCAQTLFVKVPVLLVRNKNEKQIPEIDIFTNRSHAKYIYNLIVDGSHYLDF